MHLNEDDLIEMFYGDATVASRRHLTECDECRTRSEETSRFLSNIPESHVPEPDEGWEERLWSRLNPALGERKRPVTWPTWLPLAAIGLLILGLASFLLRDDGSRVAGDDPVPAFSVDDAARSRMLMMVILDHLDEAEKIVIELSNADDGDLPKAQVELAADLLERNRLYRQSAELTGNHAAARLLGELELILVETSRGEPANGSIELVRELIGEGELLFKMNILRNEIESGAWSATTPSV